MNKFSLELFSNLDYEELVINVCWNNITVAMINKDKGIDELEIEIFPPLDSQESWKFSYSEFVKYLEKAKKRLVEVE